MSKITPWKRLCPGCKRELFYSTKSKMILSEKESRRCISCSLKNNTHCKGRTPWNKGLTCDSDERVKSLMANLIRIHTGEVQSPETIAKRIAKTRGKKRSEETRRRIGESNSGKIRTEETKRKLRVAKLERFQRLGIPAHKDNGADEYFHEKNKGGSHFVQEYTIPTMGYRVDGYDPIQHVIVELDTPYHRHPAVKERDIVRQRNIIQYYVSIGKPLNGFYRISI